MTDDPDRNSQPDVVTTRLRRLLVISGIALAVLVVLAVVVYAIAFVLLGPMMA